MSKINRRFLAEILRVLVSNRVKLESPYDFDNFIETITHEDLCPFFYGEVNDEGEGGEKLDLMEEIKKALR